MKKCSLRAPDNGFFWSLLEVKQSQKGGKLKDRMSVGRKEPFSFESISSQRLPAIFITLFIKRNFHSLIFFCYLVIAFLLFSETVSEKKTLSWS